MAGTVMVSRLRHNVAPGLSRWFEGWTLARVRWVATALPTSLYMPRFVRGGGQGKKTNSIAPLCPVHDIHNAGAAEAVEADQGKAK
eukprot:scaffold2624_cov37-Tisochrysis_lutea.AAC.1